MKIVLLIIIFSLINLFCSIAQSNTNDFSYLSKPVYKDPVLKNWADVKYKESVKITNPILNDNLAKSQLMRNFYNDRRVFFLEMLHEGSLITEGKVHQYVNSILNDITKANQIPPMKLFIVKDYTINAFNMGEDAIYVHLGLITSTTSKEQLIYVMAHEVAHDYYHHYDSTLMTYVKQHFDKDVRAQKNKIMSSEYGRVSALNKLFIPILLENQEESRKHETEADVFAYKTLKKNNNDINEVLDIFDIFETLEDPKDSLVNPKDTFLNDLSDIFYLNTIELDYSRQLKFKTESSLGFFEDEEESDFDKKENELEELLRSHPYNKDRQGLFVDMLYNENYKFNGTQENKEEYKKIQQLALKEIIVNSLYSLRLDHSIYFSIEFIKKYGLDVLPMSVIPTSFEFLAYEKIKHRAGKRIDFENNYYTENYNRFLHFLNEISPQQSVAIAQNWVNHFSEYKIYDNPFLSIIDAIDENKDNFMLRYENEKQNNNNNYFFLKPLKIIENDF